MVAGDAALLRLLVALCVLAEAPVLLRLARVWLGALGSSVRGRRRE